MKYIFLCISSGAYNIDVHLGNENIKQIDCIDYLGVKLDAHLTWNDQIDAVCKKLVYIISRLSRLRHVLAPRILMYIYQGIIQPRFDYALTIWGVSRKLATFGIMTVTGVYLRYLNVLLLYYPFMSNPRPCLGCATQQMWSTVLHFFLVAGFVSRT